MIMTTAKELKRWESAYRTTMQLYVAIKDSDAEVLRSENTDALDFVADVELKARDAAAAEAYYAGKIGDYKFFMQLLKGYPAELLTNVPLEYRLAIGKEFCAKGLTITGPYKKLYFRIKGQL
jgi:hypothetical protein